MTLRIQDLLYFEVHDFINFLNYCSDLSLPPEERVLRSTYRSANKVIEYAQLREQGYNSTYAAKRNNGQLFSQGNNDAASAYDLGNFVDQKSQSGDVSEDEDDKKIGKLQKRWEIVLNRKSNVIEGKQKHMNDMLMKKFKREKTMAQALQDRNEQKLYDDERRAEKFEQARIRREIADS